MPKGLRQAPSRDLRKLPKKRHCGRVSVYDVAGIGPYGAAYYNCSSGGGIRHPLPPLRSRRGKLSAKSKQREKERETGAIGTLIKDPETGEYRVKREDET